MKKFRKILFAAAAIVAAFAAVRVCILLDKLEFIKGAVEKNIQADMRAADEYLKGIDTVFDAYEKNVRAALDSKPKWRALYRYATFDGQGAEKLFGEHFRQNIIESERQRWENLWDDFEYSLAKNANSLSMKLGVGLGGGASERGIFAQDISFESSAAVSSAYLAGGLAAGTAVDVVFGFAAGGAAAGSVCPAAGTVLFTAGGLAVGFAVDWWCEKSADEEMEKRIIKMLENARGETKIAYKKSLSEKIEKLNKRYYEDAKKACLRIF